MKYQSNILESTPWSISIDLWSDFSKIAKQIMLNAGLKGVSDDHAVYECYNFTKRMIEPLPRKVFKSQEFQCPVEYEQALSEFVSHVECGDNLQGYLSDKILYADKTDDLLNDWNIHHFHLTRRFREDGFAKRSDYEIFAWVTSKAMYLIQIYPHKKDYLYSTQEMIKIIHTNWPELLENYHMKGVPCLTEEIDDEMYNKIREAHISTAVQIAENEVYCLMGGGYMSNGASGEAMRISIRWHNRMCECEKMLKANKNIIFEFIQSARGKVDRNLEICLLTADSLDDITVIERKNRVGIQMLLKDGKFRFFILEDMLNGRI